MSVSFRTFITVPLSRDTYRGTPVSVSFRTQFLYIGTLIVGHLSLSVSVHLSRFLYLVTLMLALGHASQSYISGQISRLIYLGTCIMRHVSWDMYLGSPISGNVSWDTYLRSFISRGIRYGIHYSAHASRDTFLGHVSRDMCRDMCHMTRASLQVSWDTFLDHLSRNRYLD